ncbi:serine/threonine-protein kinase, partial [Streptomyces sp. NPDC058953]|uniref:serine/threonine-protein kinase n=1 Tax=Streptomyces sp. NPDC058953 TaxID=3346676 RepID=UPI0036CE5728
MGTVWRAHDETVDRQVAVKEPRVPESLGAAEREKVHQRMRREARAAARIDHPAVVTVHDVVVEDGRPWLVMEWVRGQSLAARLADGTLDVREAARIGLAVLGALDAAHGAGVLHRDVKPDNVLLGGGEGPAGDERVVLTDFGIARVDGEQGLTETGAFVGSPEYVAPERVLGQRPGPASDLWSLGVMLYTVVEGVSPFRRANAPATLQAVLSAEPQALSHGPGAFGDLVTRLLRKDPALRPGASEIRRALESLTRPPAYDPTLRLGGHHPHPAPPVTVPAAPAPAAGAGGRWVPPALRGNKKAGYGLTAAALALAAAVTLVVVNPIGGGDDGAIPAGWVLRYYREVLAPRVSVPS